MYVLGDTEKHQFPLILVVGREPNYDDELDDSIGIINKEHFKSMSGGVWVTAYTQVAKQCFGPTARAWQLKALCLDKNASPIAFTNAFPVAIPNAMANKAVLRSKVINRIPTHISGIFDNPVARRYALVIQHGADKTEASSVACAAIARECKKRDIPYFSTPFFYNGNSVHIQSCLREAAPIMQSILADFVAAAPNQLGYLGVFQGSCRLFHSRGSFFQPLRTLRIEGGRTDHTPVARLA